MTLQEAIALSTILLSLEEYAILEAILDEHTTAFTDSERVCLEDDIRYDEGPYQVAYHKYQGWVVKVDAEGVMVV